MVNNINKETRLRECREAFDAWYNQGVGSPKDLALARSNAWFTWKAAYESAKIPGDGYRQFFDKLWNAYCSEELDFKAGDLVRIEAMKLGLIRREVYSLEKHGEVFWEIEEGDPIYFANDKPTPPQNKPANVDEALKLESVRESLVFVNNAFGYEGEEFCTPPYPRWRRTIDSVNKSIATLDKMLEALKPYLQGGE